MGWQLRLFDLMAASQQAGDYIMACTYGEAFLHILGLKDIPQKQMPTKGGGGAELLAWQNYYTALLMTGIGKIGQTINSVRTKYKSNIEIPQYTRPRKEEVAA